jgi:hypothetical protein
MKRFLLTGIFLCLFLISFLPKVHARSEYCVKGQVKVPTSFVTSAYYPGNTPLPYMEITIYDKNSIGQNKLASTTTNHNGDYNVCFKASDTIDEKKDLIVSHKLKNEWISVRDCKACKSYKLESTVIWNVDPGDVDLGVFYFPSFDEDRQYNLAANLFAMATWAIEYLVDEHDLPVGDALYKVVYPTDEDTAGKAYYQTIYMGEITDEVIAKRLDDDRLDGFPMDAIVDTLFHEIGHAIASLSNGYTNKTSGYDGGDGSESHFPETIEYADTAFSEGWAEFISYLITKGLSKPGADQKLQSFDSTDIDDYFYIENRRPNSMKECNETNVAAVFWDLLDKDNEKQGIVVESYMDSETHSIEFDSNRYMRHDEETGRWDSIRINELLALTDDYYIVYATQSYWDESIIDTTWIYGVYAVRRDVIEEGSFEDNVIQLFNKSAFDARHEASLDRSQLTELNFYSFKDVLYFDFNGDLFRLDLTDLSVPVTQVMSSKIGFLFDYPADINAKNIRLVRDGRLEGKKRSHALYFYAPSTDKTRKKMYRLVEEQVNGELDFSIEEVGIAPTKEIDCKYFHQDKCHFFESNDLDRVSLYYNQLHTFDPETAKTKNLWPNSYSDVREYHYGDFEDTVLYFNSADDVLAVNNQVYILFSPSFYHSVVFKIDLKYKTVERFYGFYNEDINEQNYTGMLSQDVGFDVHQMYVDGDRLILMSSPQSLETEGIYSIPMYPESESYVGYCGHDDIQIDLLDLWDHLDNSHNDIIKYTDHLKEEFGGDFDALLAASWIRPKACESETNFETMVHHTLTMDAPLND